MRGFLLALLLLGSPAARADEARTRDFFAAIAGEWLGSGETLGMASTQRARWEPALDAAFFRFVFDNRMTTSDGKESRFRAEAFYRVGGDGAVTGTWLDSRGMTLPLTGLVDDSGALTIDWGTAETERGRSTYRLLEGALEVTDEVMNPDGGWRVFGRTVLRRQP
ncbi:MAG TPA: hypothetical protein VH856_10030 [Steroidobacteraceae bacterium]|jgi:hypothetical protein